MYTTRDRSKRKLVELEDQRKALVEGKQPVPPQLDKDIKRERDNVSRPSFTLSNTSELQRASLVVVDEYSMIDERLGADLLSFNVPVLALGDPGQLPPVRGKSFFKEAPDVMLTEIHRQAEGNPILWMSREVREGRPLRVGTYGESRVFSSKQVGRDAVREAVLSADQLLVGINTTRRNSNARMRELRGLSGAYPKKGDRLVCLRNNHEAGLLNGQIWESACDSIVDGYHVVLALNGDDGEELAVRAHNAYFRGKEPPPQYIRDAECFDYGYALTVHKAQGSQWKSVALFDEWHMRDRKEWLYTGITRAAERVDVVLP